MFRMAGLFASGTRARGRSRAAMRTAPPPTPAL